MENTRTEPHSKGPATVTDVARYAGVGIGTVSRVLNNHAAVRPETVENVRSAMKALGYQRSRRGRPPLASSSRRARRASRPQPESGPMVVGLGKFGLRWIVDRAPIYSYVLHELESILQKSSNQLQLTQFNNWSEVNQLAKNQKPAGIFFIGNAPDGENSSIPTGVPCVQIMGRLPSPLIDHVAPDHRRVWRTAAEWLIGHGHRHCAVISEAGLSLDLVTHEFAHLMQSSGGASHRFSDPDLVRIAADRHETNAAVIASFVDRIVKLEPRPTAIVSAMDILTPPIYQELRQHGIRPQEDIAIVSINNETPYLTSLNPKPIAIDLQPHDIALQAVQQLAWRRQHPEAACTRSLVAPKLIEPPA